MREQVPIIRAWAAIISPIQAAISLNHACFIKDGGERAAEIRSELKMRTVIAVIAIALLTVTAHAQGAGKPKRQQQDASKTEDQAKRKAAEQAYKNALKNIPVSNEKLDPWKSMR